MYVRRLVSHASVTLFVLNLLTVGGVSSTPGLRRAVFTSHAHTWLHLLVGSQLGEFQDYQEMICDGATCGSMWENVLLQNHSSSKSGERL